MDFEFPPDDDPRRLEIREWLGEHPRPTGKDLAAAGLIVPHWPEPWGRNADPMTQVIIAQELEAAGVPRTGFDTPNNAIGIGWAAPTIFLGGTEAQKQRYLPKIFSGEEIWCQMFSEPDAGSDLASLATRAVRDGDEYVINGTKIWTSGGHHSQFGILIARTDPDVPKHRGISYFICPTDVEGLTMSPIVDMTTAHSFNECHFDDVRLPVSMRIGEEGDGWRLAKATLANERVNLSSGGSLWGSGPTAHTLLDLIRRGGGLSDPLLRQRAAALHIEAELLRLNRLRTLSSRLRGETPGPEASIQKIMSDEHGQHVMALAKDVAGASGMLTGSGPPGRVPAREGTGATEINLRVSDAHGVEPIWHYGFLFSPALTIGGGTFAVQRNIVAEMVLGLPREINVEKGLTWAQTRRRAAGVDSRQGEIQ